MHADTWGEYTELWNALEEDEPAWPIFSLAFNPRCELLYAGDASGRLTTYTGGSEHALERQTSFLCSRTPLRRLFALDDDDVLVQSDDTLQLRTMGGRRVFGKTTTPNDPFTASAVSGSTAMVCTSAGTGSLIDLATALVSRRLELEPSTTAMSLDAQLVAGTAAGDISTRDLRSAAVDSFRAFDGPVCDLVCSPHHVFAAGPSTVRVFDRRSMRTPIAEADAEGARLRLGSVLWICHSSGYAETRTLRGFECGDEFIEPALSDYAYASAFGVAPSQRAALVADTDGVLHVWTRDAALRMATGAGPDLLGAGAARTGVAVDNEAVALSCVAVPPVDEPLLSRMDALCDVGRPVSFVDPELSGSLRRIDAVEYAPNPRTYRRNQRAYGSGWRDRWREGTVFYNDRELTRGRSKFLSVQRRRGEQHPAPQAAAPRGKVPKQMQMMRIAYSRFGIEDFDFSLYNATRHSGLEGDIANAHANAVLQLLCSVPELCAMATVHAAGDCTEPLCLECQLGFLFRMLRADADAGAGASCQAALLLRTLADRPEPHALELLEDANGQLSSSLGVTAQRLLRFLLEQFGDRPALEQQLFGLAQTTATKCPCGDARERTVRMLTVDLDAEPNTLAALLAGGAASVRRATQPHAQRDFAQLLSRALSRTETTRAWCPGCRRFQLVQTRRRVAAPSAYLLVTFAQTQAAWPALPHTLTVGAGTAEEGTAFQLAAVVSSIRDTPRGPEHLVAHVWAGEWLLFNDFLVQPMDVVAPADWCTPVVALYRRAGHTADRPSEPAISTRILTHPASVLDRGEPVARRNQAVPLTKDEARLVELGQFTCAFDAEFVVLDAAKTEVFSDGTQKVLRPEVHSLARLSVVRASGALRGVPFIDDYVWTERPVADLATKYSGIHQGDLSLSSSPHRLSTMKEVYKKLRLLVDSKCTIIGHGLKHDFRVCNIVVPVAQQQDTMVLFQSARHIRPIALRFLYWFFFGETVQVGEHSSVEDARTALSVYEKYVEIGEARVDEVLDQIYEMGAKLAWKTPG
ncbi:poly(A)-specific ribonuclease [Coemansia spiralis]|uniref:Poly(A)-specific ribonuclease n=2 Tax=Coemansia TaxID=4863 RepID=A0A9W8GCP6_9FUNG|nr:poly(A)-specific ribonuclease [Coemansia umbellata]KAJ2624488.1 poly(A)-specific ribonuclease [Coemansia sp. RSA 1358]KAJ2679547.1 poly(A)-specific ribonuclease [Coemansia spiralis]